MISFSAPAPTADLLQPMSSTSNQTVTDKAAQDSKSQMNVGATWTNSGSLNIDLDNLLISKTNKQSTAPSMNQLASNPQSPINQPKVVNQNNVGSSGFNNFGMPGFMPGYSQMPPQNNQFFAGFK